MRRRLVLGTAVLALAGCSVERLAADAIGDALAGGGGVYTTDDDPDLVREAIPFGLKTYESLLAVSPEHQGLLLAAAGGFAGYAYLLQQEADLGGAMDLQQAVALRTRASRLFLRGRDYALRGLDTRHPGFAGAVRSDPAAAMAETTAEDVALLYWAGAAWAGAIAADTGNLALVAELPIAGALVQRVLDLDEAYDDGAAQEFFIAYEGGRPGGSAAQARRHYERALALSGGKRASVHLALAEAVAVPAQDIAEFNALIAAALAVDPEAERSLRLVNTLAHRRAEWLAGRLPELFVDGDAVAIFLEAAK